MTRIAPLLPATLLALACQGSLAQEIDTSYDGRWSARWETAAGVRGAANVVIADYAGTWRDLPVKGRAADKTCGGKTFQITVQASHTKQMQFMVWGSSLSPACPDLAVDLKPTNDKTLEGTLGTDMKVTLTRRR